MAKYNLNPTDVLAAIALMEEARKSLVPLRRGMMSLAKSWDTSSTGLLASVRAAYSAAAATAECYHLLLFMEEHGGEATREQETTLSATCKTSSINSTETLDHICCDIGCAWCLARPGGVSTCDFHSREVTAG
jgi:hypothetical protein